MDGAPFVGWSSSGGKGYLVATGFAAWGISNGTAAAMILTDLVTGKDNRWTSLFDARSEEHTSELQSLMRISYAVFCLKKTNTTLHTTSHPHTIQHLTQQ